jgi:hypothetical protein
MTTETGGPAFPCAEWLDTIDPSAVNPMHHQGMTLRDYFAGEALIKRGFNVRPYDNTDEVAKDCYKMADAMLKARRA